MGQSRGQWYERCVSHYDDEVVNFFEKYFNNYSRNCLVIAGAGFDPRSTGIIQHLSKVLGCRLTGYVIKEERPDPDAKLVTHAQKNLSLIERTCSNFKVFEVDIFARDGAVIGGRSIIRRINEVDFSHYSDVVIDMSALSIGVSFPVVLFIFQKAQQNGMKINVHITIISNPELDGAIQSDPNDQRSDVHGFDLQKLYGEVEKARLWLPILSEKKLSWLKILHSSINPHDTCPILPFPSEDPKRGDRIACKVFTSIQSEWGGPLDNEWGLEPQNFVYSDERKPLDIYRTILSIDNERTPVFEAFGGSTMILSPIGGKVPAIGALMAALERKFPVVYVEALAYNVDWSQISGTSDSASRMVHIWLYGDAYLLETEK